MVGWIHTDIQSRTFPVPSISLSMYPCLDLMIAEWISLGGRSAKKESFSLARCILCDRHSDKQCLLKVCSNSCVGD